MPIFEDEKMFYVLLQEKPFLKAFLLKEKKETISLVYYLLVSLPLFILYTLIYNSSTQIALYAALDHVVIYDRWLV